MKTPVMPDPKDASREGSREGWGGEQGRAEEEGETCRETDEGGALSRGDPPPQ